MHCEPSRTSRTKTSVIRYCPPKSQVWGHQVGRLPATVIVERCLTFLDSHCTVLNSQPSELIICWDDGSNTRPAEEVADDAERTLGKPTRAVELPAGEGKLHRERRWSFSVERLPVVATWFDKLADQIKTEQVVAQSSTFWAFAWRDDPASPRPLEAAGGMLGLHLGRPHRITTMFSFRDLENYASVKAALADLRLVELSDKHLRPKIGGTTAGRKAK